MTTQTAHLTDSRSLADQIGIRIASQLDSAAMQLPHDISERLRAARMRALAHRSRSETVSPPVVLVQGGSGVLGGGWGFWGKAASVLPLLALTAGLLGIGTLQEQVRLHEIAEVDAELLTGDLPTTAYTDPGFAQYLKLGVKD